MRRMICFLLIMAFCLSLACPVFANSPAEDGPAKKPVYTGTNPKTGDIIMFWGLILVVSMVALGAVYVIYRKNFCH